MKAFAALGKPILGLALLTAACLAGAWPGKPVTVIVPWPTGGPSDIATRPVSKGLSEALEQPFVIENRAGAGGNIGSSLVARAPADGHTLLITASGPLTINKHLYRQITMQTPEFKRVIADTGSEFVGTDAATFTRFVQDDAAR